MHNGEVFGGEVFAAVGDEVAGLETLIVSIEPVLDGFTGAAGDALDVGFGNVLALEGGGQVNFAFFRCGGGVEEAVGAQQIVEVGSAFGGASLEGEADAGGAINGGVGGRWRGGDVKRAACIPDGAARDQCVEGRDAFLLCISQKLINAQAWAVDVVAVVGLEAANEDAREGLAVAKGDVEAFVSSAAIFSVGAVKIPATHF